MLKCKDFARSCKKNGFTFFTGVPDSTFKSWINYLEYGDKELTNLIAVNECEATAISAGYHLATGKNAVLYMQNDGFGKTINPLTSLCNPEVYSIPILLMIGWRGEPGKKDACQHKKMGAILEGLLDLMEIPYEIVPLDFHEVDEILARAKSYMEENDRPYAIIVRKGTFEKYGSSSRNKDLMGREEALKIVMDKIPSKSIVVSTTGKLSRELNAYSIREGRSTKREFYNIGAMGCAQSIGLAIALEKKEDVFVLDGDGSLLMQMGGLATIGHHQPGNYYHIVFDNGAHDSTGGQSTCSDTVDFAEVAYSCNYRYAKVVVDRDELTESIDELRDIGGPAMIVVKVKKGARADLTRPDRPPVEYKKEFMDYLVDSK